MPVNFLRRLRREEETGLEGGEGGYGRQLHDRLAYVRVATFWGLKIARFGGLQPKRARKVAVIMVVKEQAAVPAGLGNTDL